MELGRNPISKHRINLSIVMSRLARDGTAKTVSRDQILRREEGGQEKNIFYCSADHVQDWQPFPFGLYYCYMYVCIYICMYVCMYICMYVYVCMYCFESHSTTLFQASWLSVEAFLSHS